MPLFRRSLLFAAGALPVLGRSARAEAGVLRFGLSAYPPNLLPWVSTGAAAGTVKLCLHRGLLGYGPDGKLRGELAQAWSLDDAGAWVFRLRPGAVFHNGEPVTAEDVKWSFEQIAGEKSTAFLRGQMGEFARVETPDAATVRIVTRTPQATLPFLVANNAAIVWRNSAANDPVGAGPYTLAGQERGTAVEVQAFDRFYKPGLPKTRRIRFITYADDSLRIAALNAGDVDVIEYVPWQDMPALEADPKLRLDEQNGAAFMDILFNGSKPPFNDKRVRQAVAHAVKREDIVRVAFYGRGRALEGVPIEPGTPYYDETLAHGWAYDPARAKALLAEAGFGGGFSTTLLSTAQYGMHKDTAEIVQQYLGAIGINAELKLPDWPTRVAMGTRGQYDLAIHGVSADSNDPDGLSVVMDTSLSPTFSRSFKLDAPRTTAAFARGRAEFDAAKRVAVYREMQQAALDEVPLVGLAWRSQGYGMARGVGGFRNLPGALGGVSGFTLEDAVLA